MNDPYDMVLAFHNKFGLYVGYNPHLVDTLTRELKIRLIEEELEETKFAMRDNDIIEIADGLADLLYVVYGAAISYGIDIRPIFEEVHRTNMLKVGGAFRSDGKILKPSGWEQPKIKELLDKQS